MSELVEPGATEAPGAIPITTGVRLDSLEVRVGVLEATQAWLRIEQLEAEVSNLRKTLDFLIVHDRGNDAGNSA